MQMYGVQIALEGIKEARAEWARAQTKFTADVEAMMGRLLHEAARNFMSAEQVAKFSGMTVKRVRILMRQHGLNPRDGKTLLAKKASETLADNALLLGIEPHEFDLMSPLAYLPMGEQLRKQFLETPQTVGDVDEEQRLYDAILAVVDGNTQTNERIAELATVAVMDVQKAGDDL